MISFQKNGIVEQLVLCSAIKREMNLTEVKLLKKSSKLPNIFTKYLLIKDLHKLEIFKNSSLIIFIEELDMWVYSRQAKVKATSTLLSLGLRTAGMNLYSPSKRRRFRFIWLNLKSILSMV